MTPFDRWVAMAVAEISSIYDKKAANHTEKLSDSSLNVCQSLFAKFGVRCVLEQSAPVLLSNDSEH